MRGYVEKQEQLARTMPEGQWPTDEEILAAMADEIAAQMDYERDFDPPEDDELPEDMG